MNDINLKRFNIVIKYYIFITLVMHILFAIAPLSALMVGTPFYNFQRYLGIIGVLLIIIDLIFFRQLFKTKLVMYLYGIVIVGIISSICMLRFGFKENLFTLSWVTVIFALFYSYSTRVGKEQFYKEFKFMFKFLSTVWIIAILLSITSFLFNVGYYVQSNPYFSDHLTRQGFLEHRMFGVFVSIFTSSMISGILLIYSIYLGIVEKKGRYLGFSIIYILHIILSGSRSAIVALLATLIVVVFYFFFKYSNSIKFSYLNILKALICSILVGSAFFLIIDVSKMALERIPLISIFSENRMNYKKFIQHIPLVIIKETDTIDTVNDNSNTDLLERSDTNKDNISNNRFSIWKDYLSVYKDIGLVGLSPNNYPKYLHENHSYLYVVQYVKDYSELRFNTKAVYEPHSGFIMLFVATGFLGVIIAILYLILAFTKCIYYLRLNKVEKSFYPMFSIVLFSIVIAGFDTVVFFDIEIVSIMFWLIAGYIILLVSDATIKKQEN